MASLAMTCRIALPSIVEAVNLSFDTERATSTPAKSHVYRQVQPLASLLQLVLFGIISVDEFAQPLGKGVAMLCKKCGMQMPDDNRFCNWCGTAVGEVPKPISGATVKKTTQDVGGIVLVVLAFAIIIGVFVSHTYASIPMSQDFTIRVSGTSGLDFSGSYSVMIEGSNCSSKAVYGTVPTQYEANGTAVSATFQKQSQSGTLKVQILKGNKVVKVEEATEAYGVVSVAMN